MQQSTEILFDKYEIVSCLKKDVHNAVYLSNHIYLGKKIILKTLDTVELNDNIILERFKREARILAHLDHPNLIKILDFGMFGDHFYISFEYFEGPNLRTVIPQNTLSYDQKTHLLIQLLKALNVAHQNNIIHRDIKPENILINSDYELKIADFGLAIAANENALTNKASIVGTPGYMSPEQILGDDLTTRSDIFSAGTVALELFTGVNPFIGKNINETINNIINFREESIESQIQNLTPSVQQTLRTMLKKNPSERGKNINEILSGLGVAGEIYTPVDTKIKRSYSKKMIYSGTAAVLLISSLSFYFWGRTEETPVRSFGNSELMSLVYQLPEQQKNNQQPVDTLISKSTEKISGAVTNGRLFVKVSPWADVFVNNKKMGTTPLDDYIVLTPGTYNLKLIHPDYPVYTKKINVTKDQIANVNVDFRELAGYLDCNVYPWAEVYINNEFKSQTPLRVPLTLLPGTYILTVKNPQYGSYSEKIKINPKETFQFRHNFEEIK